MNNSKAELLEDIKNFAESTRPVSELSAWWARHADAVRDSLGKHAHLAIAKRGFAALRQVLEAEGTPYMPSGDHCPVCGEKFFAVMPDKTTRDEIIAFARGSALKDSDVVVESGWLHPGRYCKNGCVVTLWNTR